MKNREVKRFYIMSEVWVTVTQSQVFNWIKLFTQRGLSTDCISITPEKKNITEIKEIENSIGGKFIEVHDYRTLIVSDLFIMFIILKYYFKSFSRYNKIIFQTRLNSLGFVFAALNWLPKIEFIYEGRGAVNEEQIFSSKGQKVTFKMKVKTFFAITSESLIMKKSNKIFCVSNALKNYYLDLHKVDRDKFSVFPGAADHDLFFYSNSLRNKTRKELKIASNDILIVYSGRLEMKWEIPDKIFAFFNNIRSNNSRFKLLLITPDVVMANKLVSDFKFEDIIIVKKVDLVDVNKYLNASDLGLLLREDTLINNVASPTKFAEYLMSGLPVIISSAVRDFAHIIDKTKFGVVVSGLDEISLKEYEKLWNSLKINKTEIARWGLNNLSKESFMEKYMEKFKK